MKQKKIGASFIERGCNFPNGFVLGKIIIPEVIFWFGLVKITSGIIIIPNTNLFGKLNNYQTKITSDKVILVGEKGRGMMRESISIKYLVPGYMRRPVKAE